MRLASYTVSGRKSYGLVTDDGVKDIGATLADQCPTLRDALAADIDLTGVKGDLIALADIVLLPVIPNPDKIICVGINFGTHIKETGRETPKHPVLFPRYPDSLIAEGEAMIAPPESETFDYEGEMAFVIGKGGRRISKADAMDHVAGYTCFNDGTIREYQRHSSQFMPGKTFPGTGAMGPWMVTTDEITDPGTMHLRTILNGQVMQEAVMSDLVFGVADLVAYCSTFTNLNPGDVIVTGTPGGVGLFRDPPVFMKEGDVVQIEISGIGTLTNPVIKEA